MAGVSDALFVTQFMTAFEEFKRTNDARLGEIEKRGSADALTEEKITRLNAALDNAKSALDRARLSSGRARVSKAAALTWATSTRTPLQPM